MLHPRWTCTEEDHREGHEANERRRGRGLGGDTRRLYQDAAEQSSDAQVIRFAFAPEAVWDMMKDNGTLAKWEKENNVRIETSTTWDEFTYFAGGHGDIVSMSTQETPVLEAETGIKTVTFGKYNYQRVPMFKRKGDPYKTLADIPKGSKICVSGPTSNAAFWGVLAKEMHNLDYRVGGGDFDLLVNDHFVNPTNLLRGDCEAAAIIPEAAVPQMRKGELELMYDGKSPFQLYKEFAPNNDGLNHVSGNNFVATAGVVQRQPGSRREVPRPVAAGRRPVEGPEGRDHPEVPAALLGRVRRGHQLPDRLHVR